LGRTLPHGLANASFWHAPGAWRIELMAFLERGVGVELSDSGEQARMHQGCSPEQQDERLAVTAYANHHIAVAPVLIRF
jgi:hypothetical protein